LKRIIDFLIACILIIILCIPMLLVALMIIIGLGPPVIFRQKRPGLNGAPFYIKKFRTMTNETGMDGKLLSNEQRITFVGKIIRKLSLDELPQLFNVLRGEMSFVGPRPLLMEYLPLYNKHQSRRHEVRPGITGWAQVNGRNNISWEKRFELDVWYVNHQSLLLDIKIIFLTVLKVFKKSDVTPEGKSFIEKFKGSNKND